MKVLPYGSPNWKTGLDRQIPPNANVTIMHLGRGGVMADGTLDPYNTGRVLQTIGVASDIKSIRPRAEIQVLWTGGHNRQQDRSGAKRPASEAGAALRYAHTIAEGHNFTMRAEEDSTSTVENATRAAGLVPDGNVIVVITDPLHYLARKVQFIMWLAFPGHRLVFVELLTSPPGTNWKSRAKHLVSTVVTIAGMAGVRRGNAKSIQHRQNQLQRLTGH